MSNGPPNGDDPRRRATLAPLPGSESCGYGVCPRGSLAAGRYRLGGCGTAGVIGRSGMFQRLGLRVDECFGEQHDTFDGEHGS